MELIEIKISKNEFDIINQFRYDLDRKYDYITSVIIGRKYEVTKETTFITYQDSRHYYLVFEGVKILSGKIMPSSYSESIKLKENKEWVLLKILLRN